MTSINTNIAAQTALRTLQSTNAQLDQTQSRISTGLKIGEAKDNAAYWSISTSLKSDNKALGTVKDALGLGAATVDTAYQGLNSSIEVLNEIKSKLTAATQNGVDKTAVQAEIAELQNQLRSIANSSAFSGENWLSVNSRLADHTASKTVVSSFTRAADGSVSLGTIDIDIGDVALFDASPSGSGILDGGKTGNSSAANLQGVVAPGVAGSAATAGRLSYALADSDLTGFGVGDVIRFNLVIDGAGAANYDVTLTTVPPTRADIAGLLTTALAGAATVGVEGNNLVITSATRSGTSEIDLVSITTAEAATNTTFTATRNINDATRANGVNGRAEVVFDAAEANFGAFGPAITLDENDTISFNIAVDGGAPAFVKIDRAVVNAALGATDGNIADGTEFATVLNRAMQNAGVRNATAAFGGGDLTISSTATSGATNVTISSVAASQGESIVGIDIVGKSAGQLTDYINQVNSALNKITSAASNLGAVASRIELQQTFVSNLMDTIDKGVSGLVDADMNEESTRLQALQVKQQLGVQALSIANQSAQNVLRLFQ